MEYGHDHVYLVSCLLVKCSETVVGIVCLFRLCGVSKQILDDSKLFEQIRQGNLQFPGSRGKELSSAGVPNNHKV